MLESEMILALTPSKIEEVSGAGKAVKYVNSLPAFKEMLEKGIGTGCLLGIDNLVKVWEDLQGFKGIVLGKTSGIQKRRELERIHPYITAERITRVKPTSFGTSNSLTDEMKTWYEENNNPNIYAKFCYDDEGRINFESSEFDGWLTEIYRSIFNQLYRVCIGIERNNTSGKTLKLNLCKNKRNCDNLILMNGPKAGGKGKRFCDNKCRNQFHARKGMRKARGEEKRAVKRSHFAI